MTLFPIVERELIVQSRRARMYWARFGLAAVGAVTFLWLLILSAAGAGGVGQGRSMFLALGGFAYAFCCLAGLVATSDSLSEEKREGTLGLLFLTDLRSRDLVLGKLSSHALITFFSLLGIVPMLAMATLLGGVTLIAVAQMGLALLSALALSTSLGMLVSTFSRHERKSLFAGVVILGVILSWPFLLAFTLQEMLYNGNAGAELDFLARFSPLTSIGMVLDRPKPASGATFWVSIGWTWALAAGSLAISIWFLPKVAHERPRSSRAGRWAVFKESMVFGDPKRRRAHRAAMLSKNPFSWLAGREHRKPQFAWGLILTFTAMYLAMLWKLGRFALEPPIPMFFILMPHFVIKIWVASEVSQRGIEDRRSGALELLLSCPVDPAWMVRGLNRALTRFLLWPVVFLIVAEMVLLAKTLSISRDLTEMRLTKMVFAGLMVSLLVDIWSLKWVASWRSLFSTSSARTLVAASLGVLTAPWVLCGLGAGATLMLRVLFDRSFGPENVVQAFALIITGLTLTPLLFAIPARLNFHNYFRELAARRFDSELKVPFGANLVVENALWRLAGKGRFRSLESARPRWLKFWWLGAGSIAALLIGTLLFGSKFFWARRVDQMLAGIRARGEPTSSQSLAAANARGTNGAAAARLEAATRLIKMPGVGKTGFDANQNYITPASPLLSASDATRIVEFTRLNGPALEGLREVMAAGQFHLPLEVDNPFGGPARWQSLPNVAHLLYCLGLSHALDGDDEALKGALFQLLEFGANLEHSGSGLWMLDYVGRRTLWRSSILLRHLLSRGALSPEEILQIRGRVEAYGDPQGSARRVRAFRVRAIELREGDVSSLAASMGMAGVWGPGLTALSTFYGVNRLSGNLDRSLARYFDYLEQVEKAVALPFPERIRQFPASPFQMDGGMGGNLFGMLFPDLNWIEGWAREGAALQRVLVTALDLELWRMKHGGLPTMLELEPRGSWHLDPYDGQPLRLAGGVWTQLPGASGPRPPNGNLSMTNALGWRVYSVGQNLQDDGGAVESDTRNYNSVDVTFTRPDSFVIRVNPADPEN